MRAKLLAALVAAVFAVGTVSFAGPAFAWEKGSTIVHTGVNVEERWDSNIFYDPTGEKDDFITIITPKISGEQGFGPSDKHKIKADYKVDLGMFGKYHSQNYGNHNILGEVALDFDEYTLTVSDNFLFTSDRAGTEFDSRNLRKENTGKAVLGMKFNKLAFDVGYSHYIVAFHSNSLGGFDRYENSVWTTGYVQVMPKTQALLEYKYKNIQYNHTSGRNANDNSVLAGVKGEITAKLTGIAKAGYKYKGYINAPSGQEDFSSAVVNTYLTYAPLERLNILFGYEREGFESTYSNNNYYTGDHFITDVNYKLGNSDFTAKGTGEYFRNDYPEIGTGETVARLDNIWGVGGGVEYSPKEWLVCGVGYKYNKRDSNIASRTYDQHIVMTNVSLMF